MGNLLKQVATLSLGMIMIVGIIVSDDPMYEGGCAIGAIIAGYLNGYFDV